jgi:hypothetical protein
MARSRFKLNRAGITELSRRREAGAVLEKHVAEGILKRIDQSHTFTKGYATKQVMVEGTAGARVGTDYPFAHWDEWGSAKRQPRAPLRRALSSLGLLSKTKESSKP